VTGDDEPTTAAEMELMEELKRLMLAAGNAVEHEMAERFEADLTRVLHGVRAVLDRADRIAELRQAKGLPPASRGNTAALAAIYERARQLRDQLEAMQ
jgi:hypothetical protein